MRFGHKNKDSSEEQANTRFGSKSREQVKDSVSMDLAIDEQKLNQEIMDQPLLYKKYSELDAGAQKALRSAELYLSQVEAASHIKYSKSETKLKVKDVDALVSIDPVVLEAKNKVIELQEQADKIRGALKACYQRHDALKDLAANKRKEFIS